MRKSKGRVENVSLVIYEAIYIGIESPCSNSESFPPEKLI